MSNRYSIVAAAVYLCLLPVAQGFDGVPDAAVPAATSPSAASGDAAAKHAKRTACLKEAKAKKLVGTAKTSFVKNCVAAPKTGACGKSCRHFTFESEFSHR
jgi:hypothetical protein